MVQVCPLSRAQADVCHVNLYRLISTSTGMKKKHIVQNYIPANPQMCYSILIQPYRHLQGSFMALQHSISEYVMLFISRFSKMK